MFKILKATCLCGAILFFAFACTNKRKDTVTISIVTTDTTAKEVVINWSSMIGYPDTLAKAKFDSLGKSSLEFTLSGSSFASCVLGNQFQFIRLYLEPGYDLKINYDPKSRQSVTFSGEGAIPNNYLAQSLKIFQSYQERGGKHNWELSSKDFFNRMDSLTEGLSHFHTNYCDSLNLSKSLADLLELYNRLSFISQEQNYLLANPPDKLNKERGIEPLPNLSSEIPFDDKLLKYGMDTYTMVLQFDMLFELNKLYDSLKWNSDAQNLYPVLLDSIFTKSEKYPVGIREVLLAKNIQWNITVMGLTPEMDSLYHKFIRKYPASLYLKPLEVQVAKWLAIGQGKKAPDFTGITLDGKRMSLSDLKGKVIYIDVWATWCGPCREEIPFSKKLQKKFKEDADLVFMYVSVDRNLEAWRKMVMGDKEWMGIHINENSGELYKWYQIGGIPRYILIDKEGKFGMSMAPRPSSDKAEGEIRKLLAVGQQNKSI